MADLVHKHTKTAAIVYKKIQGLVGLVGYWPSLAMTDAANWLTSRFRCFFARLRSGIFSFRHGHSLARSAS